MSDSICPDAASSSPAAARVSARSMPRNSPRSAPASSPPISTPSRRRIVAAALRQAGFEALGLAVDIASEDSTKAMVQATLERFGAVDVLDQQCLADERAGAPVVARNPGRGMGPGHGGQSARHVPVVPCGVSGDEGAASAARSSTSPRRGCGKARRTGCITPRRKPASSASPARWRARSASSASPSTRVTPGMTQSETQVASSSGNYLATRVAGRAIERVQVPADLVGAVMFLSFAGERFHDRPDHQRRRRQVDALSRHFSRFAASSTMLRSAYFLTSSVAVDEAQCPWSCRRSSAAPRGSAACRDRGSSPCLVNSQSKRSGGCLVTRPAISIDFLVVLRIEVPAGDAQRVLHEVDHARRGSCR